MNETVLLAWLGLLAAVLIALAIVDLARWWSNRRAGPAPVADADRSGEVRLAHLEADRLVAEGEDPHDAARALVINLCWRCEEIVGGTVDEVRVGGRRYPIRIEGNGFRYRASVPWPLPESTP